MPIRRRVGDRGTISGARLTRFAVEDTQKKLHGLFLHEGVVEIGTLKLGEEVALDVDHARRTPTRAHHSATHLLHEALRQVLGTHVAQKGSLVEPGRLRFDFSHQKPMTHQEIRAVEDLVNAMILQNAPVETHLMTPDEAIAKGALGAVRRSMAMRFASSRWASTPTASAAATLIRSSSAAAPHVRRTGDIGSSRSSAGAVASGVRRIEALTGDAAREAISRRKTSVCARRPVLKVLSG
jgi:alanyl-tRNA synthetase